MGRAWRLWSALTPLPTIPEVRVSEPSARCLGHIVTGLTLDEDSSGSGGSDSVEQQQQDDDDDDDDDDDKPQLQRLVEAVRDKALSLVESISSSLLPVEVNKEPNQGEESQTSDMPSPGKGKPWWRAARWAYRSRSYSWSSSSSSSTSTTIEMGSRRGSRPLNWEDCPSSSSSSWTVSHRPRPPPGMCTTGTQTESISTQARIRLAWRRGVDWVRAISTKALARLTSNPAGVGRKLDILPEDIRENARPSEMKELPRDAIEEELEEDDASEEEEEEVEGEDEPEPPEDPDLDPINLLDEDEEEAVEAEEQANDGNDEEDNESDEEEDDTSDAGLDDSDDEEGRVEDDSDDIEIVDDEDDDEKEDADIEEVNETDECSSNSDEVNAFQRNNAGKNTTENSYSARIGNEYRNNIASLLRAAAQADEGEASAAKHEAESVQQDCNASSTVNFVDENDDEEEEDDEIEFVIINSDEDENESVPVSKPKSVPTVCEAVFEEKYHDTEINNGEIQTPPQKRLKNC